MARLHITLSDGRQLEHTLGPGSEVIGRDADCDIPIDDPSASRRHARFALTPAGYVVEDLGSKNGTLVNDRPCPKNRPLTNGDRILAGSAVILYSEDTKPSRTSVVVADDAMTVSHATRYVGRDKKLTLSRRRLELLYELGARLSTLQDRQPLLENATDICFEMLQFERGAIGIRQRHGRGLDWPVVRNLRGAEGELTISRSLLNRALEHGERAIFADSGAASADPTVSMVQHGIRSAMCVPLSHEDRTLGVIYGDRISTSTAYDDEDIDFFAAIAQQVSVGLINAHLMEDRQQMIRLNHGLDLARSIQTGFLPTDLPDRTELRIGALNDPGDHVSGDYYDVLERPDGRVWCLMADVTGEGVPAALLMANLQAAVRLTVDRTDDPGRLLSEWNGLICKNTSSSKFITCALALIDPAAHRIWLANAGHCMPLIVRPGCLGANPFLEEPGFPLGVVEGAEFPVSVAEMGPDPFTFFCYTDGVIEAMDPRGGFFGTDRLERALADRSDLAPNALVKHVRKSVATFADGARQSDDITMLAVQVQ